MKRILLLLLTLLPALAMLAGGPQIKFDSRSHDFGTIGAEGGPVSHTFHFTNTGDEPLIIVSATASCGCTRPEYTTSPVKPGGKGTIKVSFLPSGQPLGEFGKSVRVRTNVSGKRQTLRIAGVIVPGDKKPEHK
ncbi:MAG: DUF1573 domain-containing protein [Muribaculaceae bacterium]|nr:DUF1573 domain-containing protein [Muribaculaceae bacterium]